MTLEGGTLELFYKICNIKLNKLYQNINQKSGLFHSITASHENTDLYIPDVKV